MKNRGATDTTPLWYFLEKGDYLVNVRTHKGAEITGVRWARTDGGDTMMLCINGKWHDRSALSDDGWRMTDVDDHLYQSACDVGW